MKKTILIFVILSFIFFNGYCQDDVVFTIQMNPNLNSYKFRSEDYKFKPNVGFSSALYLMGTLYVEIGYSKYVSRISEFENTNYEKYTAYTFSNFMSHVGVNIGNEICFSPYIYWGMTDILEDRYLLYFNKYKTYSGSWKGRCLMFGFGAKLNIFSFEPYFFSIGFSKMYPWKSLALGMYDPSRMQEDAVSMLPYTAASKQLCFELGIGLYFGDIY